MFILEMPQLCCCLVFLVQSYGKIPFGAIVFSYFAVGIFLFFFFLTKFGVDMYEGSHEECDDAQCHDE